MDYETVQHILNGLLMAGSAVSIWPDTDGHAVYAVSLQTESHVRERALNDLIVRTHSRAEAERALEFEAPLLFKLAYHADHAMEMEANLGPTPEFILRAAVVHDRTEIVHPFEEI